MFLRKTNKGRVVYNRKPHVFELRDVKRIAENTDLERFAVPAVDWERFFNNFLSFFNGETGLFEGFGGGMFGGGGASGSIELKAAGKAVLTAPSIEESGVIIIVMTEE